MANISGFFSSTSSLNTENGNDVPLYDNLRRNLQEVQMHLGKVNDNLKIVAKEVVKTQLILEAIEKKTSETDKEDTTMDE